MAIGSTAAHGNLRLQVVRAPKPRLTLDVAREFGLAQPGQPAHVKQWKRDNEEHFERTLRDLEAVERGQGPAMLGAVWAVHNSLDGDIDLGLISGRVVTTAGVGFIVDAFQNLTELETMRFHGLGTGATAEAASDTGLATELTTQYTTTSTRPTGTLTEGVSGNIYETIATVSVKAAAAVTEHGIFSQAAAPGGTLLDRSVFAVVNLATNEALTVTYDLTFPSGG